MTRAGVVNASALVAAHVSSLNASGYEHRMRVATAMETEANETFTSDMTRRIRAEPGLSAFHLRSVRVEADSDTRQETTRAEWSNGSVRLLRAGTGNRTAYERLDPAGPGGSTEREGRLTGRLTLRDVLRQGNYSVVSVGSTNGSTRIALVADDGTVGGDTRFSAMAIVDSDGRIRQLNATMRGSTPGNRTVTTFTQYRLVEVGVEQVERPAWADEALREGNESA